MLKYINAAVLKFLVSRSLLVIKVIQKPIELFFKMWVISTDLLNLKLKMRKLRNIFNEKIIDPLHIK